MTSLKTFIDEARARGAYPVLVTPDITSVVSMKTGKSEILTKIIRSNALVGKKKTFL